MIPIRDSIKPRLFPLVNYAIIIINGLVFLYEVSLGEKMSQLFSIYGLIPDLFLTTFKDYYFYNSIVPVFTSMFLHGGWMHFLGNMWFLYIFGDNVEDSMGHGRYLTFYLLCGISAAMTQVFSNPESTVPMVGASGAIAGVMGAYMVQYPRGRILTLIPIFFFFQFINVPALVFLLIWIGIQTLQGFFTIGSEVSGGVAWWAHIGGFIFGIAMILLFRKPRTHFDDFDDPYFET